MSLRFSIVIFIITTFCAPSYSQKAIQLTNVSSGKKVVISEGHRVVFSLKENSLAYIGIVESIGDTSVAISGKTYSIEGLRSIGRKRKGSGFWAFASGFVGAGLIIGAVTSSNDDPCPSCTTVESSGEGWTAVEVGLGVAVIGLGINTAVRNSPKDVISKWKLEIVESPKKTP